MNCICVEEAGILAKEIALKNVRKLQVNFSGVFQIPQDSAFKQFILLTTSYNITHQIYSSHAFTAAFVVCKH